ncbi:MAG: hypothetical protein Ct9H300mP12_11900 [Acidimicrobiales bacterium]|nr:MAG: hypothetical protein Ct9H300mP12_11900 [Acidimicrobiales bacterium]
MTLIERRSVFGLASLVGLLAAVLGVAGCGLGGSDRCLLRHWGQSDRHDDHDDHDKRCGNWGADEDQRPER